MTIIKVLLVLLLLIIVAEGAFIGWLMKNFTEFRDITTHNSTVFSTAIAQHSTKIADISRDVKDANEDLYKEQDETSKKIKEMEKDLANVATKVEGVYFAVNTLAKSK